MTLNSFATLLPGQLQSLWGILGRSFFSGLKVNHSSENTFLFKVLVDQAFENVSGVLAFQGYFGF